MGRGSRRKRNSSKSRSESTSGTRKDTDGRPVPDIVVPPPLAPPKTKPTTSILSPITLIIPTEEATPLPRAFQIQSADGHIYELEYPIFRNEYHLIFAVTAIKRSKMFAMKVELKNVNAEDGQKEGLLKMELSVLNRIAGIRRKIPKWGSHFLDMYDCGNCKNFRFIISTLCGPNLKVLRGSIFKRNFTYVAETTMSEIGNNKADNYHCRLIICSAWQWYTKENVKVTKLSYKQNSNGIWLSRAQSIRMSAALLINYNTFNAIHDLHKIGYAHSLIRPTHFVIGTGNRNNIIFMIDFTQCSNPLAPLATNRRPDRKTLKFVSRNVMDGKRCTFNDDLESWLYMAIDIVNDALLPFNSKTAVEEMRRKKCQMFYRYDSELDSSIPDEYSVIIDVLNSTRYNSTPKYDRIRSLILDGLRHRNLNPNDSWLNFVDKKKIAHVPLYSMQAEKLSPVNDDFLGNLFKGKQKGMPIKMEAMPKDKHRLSEDADAERQIRHAILNALANTQSIEGGHENEDAVNAKHRRKK